MCPSSHYNTDHFDVLFIRSWNEYADIKEKLTGKKIERVYIPREELIKRYKAGNEPAGIWFVLRIATDTPAHDFTGIAHNELLNPGNKYFVPSSYEDYIKSVSSTSRTSRNLIQTKLISSWCRLCNHLLSYPLCTI